MVSFKNIVLLANVAVAAFYQRDAATTLTDLKTVNADTVEVLNAIEAYSGGTTAILPVRAARDKLFAAIDRTAANALKSVKPSDAEAQNMVNYISNTIEPSVKAMLEAVKSKKALLDAAGLTHNAKEFLANLKSKTDNLGNVLNSDLSPELTRDGKAVMAKFDAEVQAVIDLWA
ncbi:hypothetical protein E4U21_002605 [Claviceps maximensis]|nr:hypothetical protein E4U21_002605 [Claviceps maximensis]